MSADARHTLPIHHVGRIVASIDAYLERSPWPCRRGPVTDPRQGARLALLEVDAGSPWIELVEPTGDDSPVWGAGQRDTVWHHVCLTAGTRAAGDRWLEEHRLLPVTEWTPAVLFDGRPVRFAYSRNRELVELLADADADADAA
jgi:hypothetical protein